MFRPFRRVIVVLSYSFHGEGGELRSSVVVVGGVVEVVWRFVKFSFLSVSCISAGVEWESPWVEAPGRGVAPEGVG
jgi:hypothetical protein